MKCLHLICVSDVLILHISHPDTVPGGGVLSVMHGRSRVTIDPRVPGGGVMMTSCTHAQWPTKPIGQRLA